MNIPEFRALVEKHGFTRSGNMSYTRGALEFYAFSLDSYNNTDDIESFYLYFYFMDNSEVILECNISSEEDLVKSLKTIYEDIQKALSASFVSPYIYDPWECEEDEMIKAVEEEMEEERRERE